MSNILLSCIEPNQTYATVAPGTWRAVLKLDTRSIPATAERKSLIKVDNPTIDDVRSGELPFTFDVNYTDKEKITITIHNGEEKIVLDDIAFGRDKSTAKDTVLIRFPLYKSYIKAIVSERIMQGYWVVETKDNYQIPFEATQGQNYRFTQLKKQPSFDLTGRWETTFGEGEEAEKAIGEFNQKGNYLSGTFATETGDYRFLEGTMQGDKFYLSKFDGAHAFLFEGKILADKSLIGTFRSGKHHQATWVAKLNPQFQLRDPNSLTKIKSDKMSLQLADANGKIVSLNDPTYQGKIKFVQVMGTWCPNCMDEAAFLSNYLKEKNNPKLSAIGLAFERIKDNTAAYEHLNLYKQKMGIDYAVLLAGKPDKESVARVLPMLEKVMAYPTMIIVDANNKIRRVHTGFAGPATSEHAAFRKEFDEFVNHLLHEKN
ncbi:MAG: TlpA family protein disulfide reductase [Saprospiraceae bacterium]|nr:TlpA family protein disulfide reductase [Saprospiraceae bacterium]